MNKKEKKLIEKQEKEREEKEYYNLKLSYIEEAILTNNLNIFYEKNYKLVKYNYLKKYLNDNKDNENVIKFNEILNNYKLRLDNQLNELKNFILNNDQLDDIEKINKYLNIVPFFGNSGDLDISTVIKLCGYDLKYDPSTSYINYSYLIASILCGKDTPEFIKIKEKLKNYRMEKFNNYKIFDEKGIIEYASNTRLAKGEECLSKEKSYSILLNIIEYMKKNNLVYSPLIIEKLKKTVFKDEIDKAFSENNIENNKDTITKTKIKFIPRVENKINEQLIESKKINIDNINANSGKKKGSDSYIRDAKVSEYTKNRTLDQNGYYHCELCDYMINQIYDEINNLTNDIESIKRKSYLEGKIDIIKDNSVSKRSSYFNSHHIIFRRNNGPDHIYNTICLCPNCHDKIHNDEEFRNKYNNVAIDILKNNIKEKDSNYLNEFNNLFEKEIQEIYNKKNFMK